MRVHVKRFNFLGEAPYYEVSVWEGGIVNLMPSAPKSIKIEHRKTRINKLEFIFSLSSDVGRQIKWLSFERLDENTQKFLINSASLKLEIIQNMYRSFG